MVVLISIVKECKQGDLTLDTAQPGPELDHFLLEPSLTHCTGEMMM